MNKLLTVSKLLGFKAEKCAIGIDLLMCVDHTSSTMKKNVKDVSGFLVELLCYVICFCHGVVEPLDDGGIHFFLVLFTLCGFLLSLSSRRRGRFGGSMTDTRLFYG